MYAIFNNPMYLIPILIVNFSDWQNWNEESLDYEDEKILEKRRQLLQRELAKEKDSDNEVKSANKPPKIQPDHERFSSKFLNFSGLEFCFAVFKKKLYINHKKTYSFFFLFLPN